MTREQNAMTTLLANIESLEDLLLSTERQEARDEINAEID
jgi:hypothetical protein